MMKPLRLGRGGEFDLIRQVLEQDTRIREEVEQTGRRALSGGRILSGAGGDCAIVAGRAIAISLDAVVEDVHFRRDWMTPPQIGFRAAVSALSDLAPAVAAPIGLFVTLAVREVDVPDFALGVMAGVSEAAAMHGATLLGGDVCRSNGPALIDVAVTGETVYAISRAGASPGDAIWVTGVLGAAAAAVRVWNAGGTPPEEAAHAFHRPVPRIAEARWLAERHLVRAAIDLSDGLAGDAGHLAAASGVRILLDTLSIPVAGATRAVAGDGDDAIALAVAGGEDYELCFAAPDGAMRENAAAFTDEFGIGITRVGRVVDGEGIAMIDEAGNETGPPPGAWSHFE